jgi:hypothetical protein
MVLLKLRKTHYLTTLRINYSGKVIVKEMIVHTHTDTLRERERANMHSQAMACTGSFAICLTSAEGLKLECFK